MTTILIADDATENRYLLVSLLKGHGYDVVAATNGAEALAQARSSPPDLIVTDVLMPLLDGFELCRRWKRDERLRHVPFVIYTATYTDPKDERLALSLGADRFLVKPQKPEVLLEAVREVLREVGRDRAAARPGPSGDETEVLRLHNEALMRKLEQKVTQLQAEIARRSQKTRELEGLLDGATAVLAGLDFEKTARRIFDDAKALTGARAGYVALLPASGEDGEIVFAESEGAPCAADPGRTMSIPGLEVETCRAGRVARENDFMSSRWARSIPDGHMELRNLLLAPMDVDGKTVGIMGLANKPGAFDDDDEQVAAALGKLAALGFQRWRAEQMLRESASLLRIAGRMARLGGWSVDLSDMRMLWSDEVAAIHEMPEGYSPATAEEAIGYYAPECRARMREVFGACARDGTPYDVEMEIIAATGKRVWVRVIGEAIRDSSGVIKKVQGAFQDITDRRRAEDERKKLESQLVQSQKMESIGRLAGGVAHDFNNLLSVVLSYARFAIDALGEGDPVRVDLEEISNAGERAAALTRQLLAFSRRQLLAPKVLSLNKVVTGISTMLRRLLGEHIDVEVHLNSGRDSILADRGQIDVMIMNLAVNARDAMPEGGKLIIETANVELDQQYADQHVAVNPGRFVMLSVTDTGTGMDAATAEHVFEPFFTTKEKGTGTGLGLSTVYGIVKQSGGNVWVYSEPGRGTTFKVYLPWVDAVAETEPRPAPVMGTGNETVLVVEDEDGVRKIAERILLGAGYRVHVASNGAEVLAMHEKLGAGVDLLLTDVVMPRMSGRELAEQLAKTNPKLKVLYMSGYADSAVMQNNVLEPGMRFIGKPFAAAELTRKVREVLDADVPRGGPPSA